MPNIQIQNITKKYGKNLVLNNINIQIKKGECYAIVGANGNGKSTLLKILGGMTEPTSGQITYDNVLLSKYRKKILQEIGFFSEKPTLLENFSVWENLKILQKVSTKKDALTDEQIMQWLKDLQIDSYINIKVSKLSKGTQYKVAFIGCLLNNPTTLLLDEPNATIDNDTLTLLKKELIKLKQTGTTIVLVTHQLNFLTGLADRIAFLQNEIKLELTGDEFFKLNKRPLLEIDCEPASDVCLQALAKKDPNLQINMDKTHIRLELQESANHYSEFILDLLQSGLKIKQFYEVAVTPEQLYKRIIKKD